MSKHRRESTPPTASASVPSGGMPPVARTRAWMAARQSESPTAASSGTFRGWIWVVAIALDFYLLSNPLIFEPVFDESLRRAIWVTAAACVLSIPWLRWPRLPIEVLLFLGVAWFSSQWSLDSAASQSATGLYIIFTLLALAVAGNASSGVIVEGMTWGGVLIVLASWYAYEELLPGAGVADSVGVLAGVGTNRNILAYTLVLALAAAVSDLPRRWAWRLIRLACAITILVGIYLSGSATGYGSAGLVLIAATLMVVTQHLALSPRRRQFLLGAGGVTMLVLFVNFDRLLNLFGKDSQLSGRLPFWTATYDVTHDHDRMLQGFGWGAVWSHPWQPAPANSIVLEIYAEAGAPLTHGHNSWMDVLPQIGLVGVVLLLVMFVRIVIHATRSRAALVGDSDHDAVMLPRFLIIGVIGHVGFGLSEPMAVIPLGWWFLIVMACAAMPARTRPWWLKRVVRDAEAGTIVDGVPAGPLAAR